MKLTAASMAQAPDLGRDGVGSDVDARDRHAREDPAPVVLLGRKRGVEVAADRLDDVLHLAVA